jgi:rubrerythrin
VLTRRKAIASGGALVTLAVAGCGGTRARKVAGSTADLPFLAKALELERAQIALYERAAGAFRGERAALVRHVLAQEHAHAAAIEEAIRELGGTPATPEPLSAYTRGLPESANAPIWLATAVQHENAAAAAYAAAIPKLANTRLKATFAAIMTTEAEHAAALGLPR